MRRIRFALSIALLAGALFACKPEVGSEAWCKAMRDQPRGDWTVNEATEFAKSCVLR
ncbi:MAG TPA: DUF3012 domain-containing protein [Gammaproteobacteria bacterium]|nr:DUF3012 domain-containing protein [Gammaproteobacteria bacterium]